MFLQTSNRRKSRKKERNGKEIILASTRHYAMIQVLNAYNLFRTATARVSCTPRGSRRKRKEFANNAIALTFTSAHAGSLTPVIPCRVIYSRSSIRIRCRALFAKPAVACRSTRSRTAKPSRDSLTRSREYTVCCMASFARSVSLKGVASARIPY